MNRAVVLSIGDELISGLIQNSNSRIIASYLKSHGIPVINIVTVGDSEPEIIRALEYAKYSQAPLIIVTGGLGSTHDDITRRVVAKYFGRQLVFRPEILQKTEALYRRRGRKMPEIVRLQAYFPDRATPIPNPIGTAQGIQIEQNGQQYCFLPGVPTEMESMLKESLAGLINEMHGEPIYSRTIHVFGLTEGEIYTRLRDWIEQQSEIKVAFLPGLSDTTIRLTSQSAEGIKTCSKACQNIKSILGEFIIGYDDETLENVVANILMTKQLTLSVAESCTGGLIANRLTNVPGSSAFFKTGIVAYSNESKINILGVEPGLINEFGAVSEKVACEMARQIRKISQSSIGLSTTGIAGPTGATPQKPVGLVFIAIANAAGCQVYRFVYSRDRVSNKKLFSQAALNQLRLALSQES